MTDWSLKTVLESLHKDLENDLQTSRSSFGHQTAKGDASEAIWLALLKKYLPKRYSALRAHVVDSNGQFSDQIDVVVIDRQYSPFMFTFNEQHVVPAESVYAVFEAKQTANLDNVKYAKEKAKSVRSLFRTSLPIPHAGGQYPAKTPHHILAGLLTLESDWSPPLGDSLVAALAFGDEVLDIGCIAAHGIFEPSSTGVAVQPSDKASAMFLFSLISKLQAIATVPMIDVMAYAKWLA